MTENYEIISVDADNVSKRGFFCYMSKPKTPGYRQKRLWLEQRFAEGLKIKIIHEIGGRDVGFIEYLPGEYAWRAVQARDCLVIHCLWVVGKGYGARLIQECLQDARQQGKQGVVKVASDRVWLAGPKIFLENGFVEVDQAPPFRLLVHRLAPGPDPVFPGDWDERARSFGAGLTVIRTPQCPYIENAATEVIETANALGIPARAVELQTAQEVQRLSPTPYGVFAILLDGHLLAYYYLTRDEIAKRIETLKA